MLFRTTMFSDCKATFVVIFLHSSETDEEIVQNFTFVQKLNSIQACVSTLEIGDCVICSFDGCINIGSNVYCSFCNFLV